MLDQSEYHPFYEGYVARQKEEDVVLALKQQWIEVENAWNSIPEDRGAHRYAPGKWSIAEMLLHVVDAERVFSYRAMCISRSEIKNMIGFDQDQYVRHSFAENRSLKSIMQEFTLLRHASISLFSHLKEEQWSYIGFANEASISVRALSYILYGHCDHHLEILKTRYLEE